MPQLCATYSIDLGSYLPQNLGRRQVNLKVVRVHSRSYRCVSES